MEIIQTACEELAGHADSFVQKLGQRISHADRNRDNAFVKLEAQLSTAMAQIKTLRAELDRKTAQIKSFQRDKFGPSSEKKNIGDSFKDDHDDDDMDATAAQQSGRQNDPTYQDPADFSKIPNKPRGKPGKTKVVNPAHLRREVRTLEPLPDQFCACGCGTVRIGEEVLEKLAYKPAEIYVIEERYPKYTCRYCDRFVQAKVPQRALDHTRFDDSLAVGILVAKYADFLPLYRLQQIFGRSGVQLNRSTLSRLTERAGHLLKPIYEALVADIKSDTKIFADETRIPVLQPGLGKTNTCYAWAICRDDRRWRGNKASAAAFHFATSRGGVHAETLLSDFHGTLQVDAYAGYNVLTRSDRVGGPLTLAFCWAHARRKFERVEKSTNSEEAGEVLERIRSLYSIEKELQTKHATAPIRQAERQTRSKPIVDALFEYLSALNLRIPKKSTLGEAISYTMKLRDGLCVFLKDGRVEMANNPVENMIRPLALLRKNALFAGSESGGEVWTMMSSLIGTCKLNGVEPHAYFEWVFAKIANKLPRSEYDKLVPWNCPKGRHANA